MTRIREFKVNEWDSVLNHDEKTQLMARAGWVKKGVVVDADGQVWSRWTLGTQRCDVLME